MRTLDKIILAFGFPALLSCSQLDLIEPAGFETSMAADSIIFAEIGDFGSAGEAEGDVASMVKSWNPDFIVSAGDNNYYNGKLSTIKENITQYYSDYIYNFDAPDGYQCNGKAFSEGINRFFPCPGNHDANNKDGLIPYFNFFTLPGYESYYQFTWGPVTFFSVNSADGDLEEQKIWLQQKTALATTPFKIIFFHHPPYSAGPHGNHETLQWDFLSMGADIIFSGHDHLYNRIEKAGEKNVHYVVNGLGGRADNHTCSESLSSSGLFKVFCFTGDYGAIKATATYKKLVVEFYTVGEPATPIDRFEISK